MGDFPGGTVNKIPLADAGDTGSIPGPGRSHVPPSNRAHVPKPLNPHGRAWEPQLLKLACPRAHAPQEEKSLRGQARALKKRGALSTLKLEKA